MGLRCTKPPTVASGHKSGVLTLIQDGDNCQNDPNGGEKNVGGQGETTKTGH